MDLKQFESDVVNMLVSKGYNVINLRDAKVELDESFFQDDIDLGAHSVASNVVGVIDAEIETMECFLLLCKTTDTKEWTIQCRANEITKQFQWAASRNGAFM